MSDENHHTRAFIGAPPPDAPPKEWMERPEHLAMVIQLFACKHPEKAVEVYSVKADFRGDARSPEVDGRCLEALAHTSMFAWIGHLREHRIPMDRVVELLYRAMLHVGPPPAAQDPERFDNAN